MIVHKRVNLRHLNRSVTSLLLLQLTVTENDTFENVPLRLVFGVLCKEFKIDGDKSYFIDIQHLFIIIPLSYIRVDSC